MLACCAFAVFLLNQLLVPIAFLREHLFGKAKATPNTAVLWSPGAPAGLRGARFRLRPAFAVVLMVEALAIGGSVAAATLAARAAPASAEQRLLNALHASICHVLGRTPS